MIEAAINGSTSKEVNPHVPRGVDEIAATALVCVQAGASIVHNHNDDPNVGEPSVHSAEPYEAAWRETWQTYPGHLMHPTTSGERSATIVDRFAHIVKLHRRGALTMTTADAGCFALAFEAPDGPLALPIFGNSAADVAYILDGVVTSICRCTCRSSNQACCVSPWRTTARAGSRIERRCSCTSAVSQHLSAYYRRRAV